MSIANLELIATKRNSIGKLASRRLRNQQNLVPAVVYGGKEANSLISIDHNHLLKVAEQENFYSQIFNLTIDDNKQKVILKDLQRHPFKPKFLHLDFQRVKETDVITMNVHLHFVGATKCPGVKLGGLINHHANDIEVRCQAQFLPEFIEVDLSTLELGQIIHISDLKLPPNVEIPALTQGKGVDVAIASVHVPKAAKEEVAVADASTATATDDKDSSKDGKDSKTAASATKSTSGAKQDKK